jgi:hypothetical protein
LGIGDAKEEEEEKSHESLTGGCSLPVRRKGRESGVEVQPGDDLILKAGLAILKNYEGFQELAWPRSRSVLTLAEISASKISVPG